MADNEGNTKTVGIGGPADAKDFPDPAPPSGSGPSKVYEPEAVADTILFQGLVQTAGPVEQLRIIRHNPSFEPIVEVIDVNGQWRPAEIK